MQNVKKHCDKIRNIMSWTHLTEDKKMSLIKDVLNEVYNLGHADGYAEGLRQGYHDGFDDAW